MEIAAKWIVNSKAVWLNILGPVFVYLGTKYGITVDADTQAQIVLGIMAVANILVRWLWTSQPVTMAKPPELNPYAHP